MKYIDDEGRIFDETYVFDELIVSQIAAIEWFASVKADVENNGGVYDYAPTRLNADGTINFPNKAIELAAQRTLGITGGITPNDAAKVTELNISQDPYGTVIENSSFHSLVGLEYFIGLEKLIIHNNNLSALDFSGMTMLKELQVGNSKATSINITGCTALKVLYWLNTTQDKSDIIGLNESQLDILVITP
jgi:hypothetical protein